LAVSHKPATTASGTRHLRSFAPPLLRVTLIVALILQSSCRAPGDDPVAEGAIASPFGSEAAWVPIYSDSTVSVALDTTRVERRGPNEYVVRYQTRWATPHQTQAPSPFNRELILSLLRCNPTAFKTVEVSVYLNDGPLVARQGSTLAEANAQDWKTPRGSVDLASLNRACDVITGSPRNAA
jgi:hypothetical protein